MSVSARFGVRWQGDAQAAFDEAVQHLGAAAAPKRIFDRMQTGPYAPLSVRIASAGLGSPYLQIAPSLRCTRRAQRSRFGGESSLSKPRAPHHLAAGTWSTFFESAESFAGVSLDRTRA